MRSRCDWWGRPAKAIGITTFIILVASRSAADSCVQRNEMQTTSGISIIALDAHGSVAENAINLGIPYWQACSGYGSRFPRLANSSSGDVKIDVVFNSGVGSSCGFADAQTNAAGQLIGGTITLFASAALDPDCTDDNEKVGSTLAHEVGHIYGLANSSADGSCDGYIMGPLLSGMEVQSNECGAVDGAFETPAEGGTSSETGEDPPTQCP